MISLQQRLDIANENRKKGYNCAQCVMMSFCDIHNIPEQTIKRLAIGFGGGVGGLQEICGVVSAMAMIEGLLSNGEANDKVFVYKKIRNLASEFNSNFCSMLCRDLKGGKCNVPCGTLIERGIEILHNNIESKQSV